MHVDLSVPERIIDLIRADGLPVGSHLPAQMLADRLRLSRSPVNQALGLLHEKGLLHREPNRGYFLASAIEGPPDELASQLGLDEGASVSATYFRIAEDRLKGELPDAFSETLLKQRYGLTGAQLQSLLNRMSHEGWVQKKPGYGWEFSPMLTTSESLLQSYRLRLALEPAALLEPGYRIAPEVIARCRAAEQHLLQGGIQTDSAGQIHERGVRFHEALVEGSGNPFFIDTIRRVNRVRRLLSYRSTQDRKRYRQHCEQHLAILDLLEQERQEDAAQMLRTHLGDTLRNLKKISKILKP
ncbi:MULTISPECIES: GntR family transcriptional regulator [Ramlibacter]|uniref:FCD domain-containing protein n=1 Tax=Ramlibacter pinisoli TaxID=2682844 RepID=A0A6N8IYD0_9BURK|nr:GntR family transcriptional regulator [Ramlibacter pinisoli]MBA2961048.1 GntR family transcriptional regulator [Ramlibacter sp. CGMCC 1.13660]MVQ30993.1 FCD domain-containing protein [Ramlibacter pinisoli]